MDENRSKALDAALSQIEKSLAKAPSCGWVQMTLPMIYKSSLPGR